MSVFDGWKVIQTPAGLVILRGCGSAATKIHVEALIRAAQCSPLSEDRVDGEGEE